MCNAGFKVIYLNTHAALEQLRQHSEEQAAVGGGENPKGPRIMLGTHTF